jgi:hypothetical protein
MRLAHVVFYLLVWGLPLTFGVIWGRHWGRPINFLIMLELYQVGLFIYILATNARFRPEILIPGIMIWAPVSAGGFLVALILALIAVLMHRRRPAL